MLTDTLNEAVQKLNSFKNKFEEVIELDCLGSMMSFLDTINYNYDDIFNISISEEEENNKLRKVYAYAALDYMSILSNEITIILRDMSQELI